MTLPVSDPTPHFAYRTGAIALVLAAGTILAALGFEYIGGYPPCPLCLDQRYAYYAGVPALFLALVLVSAGQRRTAAALFGLVALAFFANAGLAAYHAGIEWRFWAGPDTCAGAQELTTSAGGLLDSLQETSVIRCDDAAWRFAGISLAGWNVVISLLVFSMCLRAAARSISSE